MTAQTKLGMSFGVLAVFGTVGVVLIAQGGNTVFDNKTSEAVPQVIGCRELIDHGPGDNRYVRLRDAVPLPDSAFVQLQSKTSKDWWMICLPIIPEGENPPRALELALMTRTIHNEQELGEYLEKRQFEGMVGGMFTDLGYQERELLIRSFPETNVNNLVIIDYRGENIRRLSTATGYGMLFAGIGMGLASFLPLALVVTSELRRNRNRASAVQINVANVADAMWWPALRMQGAASEPGIAVLRPNYIAFLPTRDLNMALWPLLLLRSSIVRRHERPTAETVSAFLAELGRDRYEEFDDCIALAAKSGGDAPVASRIHDGVANQSVRRALAGAANFSDRGGLRRRHGAR